MQVLRTICLFCGRLTTRLERIVLAALIIAMVALAAVQILLRNIWHTGWPWAEPLLGMGLLWMIMLGALAATGMERHVSIDLLAALLPKKWMAVIRRIVFVFAAGICVLLARAAEEYVGFQQEMELSILLGIPVWKFYIVIPVVFWLMAVRFVLHAVLPPSCLLPAAAVPVQHEEEATATAVAEAASAAGEGAV